MMIPLTTQELVEKFCRVTGRYAMYVSAYVPRVASMVSGFDELIEITKAAPYLQREDCRQILADGQGVLIFDDAGEMERCYKLTVGDEGPTELNSYTGIVTVYALTFGPDGTRNENT